MTAFYSFRLIFKVFHGTYNGDYNYNKIHESGIFMILPLVLLSIGAIFAGYFFNNILSGYNAEEFWNKIIFLSKEKHQYSSFFPIFSKTLIAIGIALAVYFYGFNQAKLNDLKKQFVNVYKFILNKWYFD